MDRTGIASGPDTFRPNTRKWASTQRESVDAAHFSAKAPAHDRSDCVLWTIPAFRSDWYILRDTEYFLHSIRGERDERMGKIASNTTPVWSHVASVAQPRLNPELGKPCFFFVHLWTGHWARIMIFTFGKVIICVHFGQTTQLGCNKCIDSTALCEQVMKSRKMYYRDKRNEIIIMYYLLRTSQIQYCCRQPSPWHWWSLTR